MEPTELKMKGPTETGSEEIAPQRPAMAELEQHRGIKRSRRDRGSSAKERISKMPACVPGKRSSIYRGVTRHRWTGRYEAHLWDKSTWNEAQNKKGKQVYLGAYDDEEAAARAYDLAALKYWGPGTLINFPVTDYARDVEEMQSVSREEYLASLRRKSSGFSRSASKFKSVARHNQNGRWEARIGQVLGNKYLYLGNYSSQEEAAAAYDLAALDYRGLNAVTNFDLSRYIRWLRPEVANATTIVPTAATSNAASAATTSNTKEEEEEGDASPKSADDTASPQDEQSPAEDQQSHQAWPGQASEPYQLPCLGVLRSNPHKGNSSAPTALSLLLSSSIFKSMRERAADAAAAPKYDPGMEVGSHSHSQFLEGAPHDSGLYIETSPNPEIFSQDLHHHAMDFPPSYGAPARLQQEEGGALGAGDSQGASYWDPFVQPLPSQQLTPC